jgi:hypothetical protein
LWPGQYLPFVSDFADIEAIAQQVGQRSRCEGNASVIQDRDTKLAAAQNAQAELVRKERELEDARREMDLTVQTKVQAELGNIRDKAKQEAMAEAKLPLAEKEQQLASMQR